jgi:predicted DNA-binding antitoxin AbrB/MazE fold protein
VTERLLVVIAVPKQVLKHNGKELPKGKTLKQSGVKPNDIITAEIFTVPVKVNLPDGRQIDIMVDPDDPLASIKDTLDEQVKQKVEDKTGFAVPKQILKHNGKELPKGQTLKQSGVKPDDTISVEIFTVPVKVNLPDGRQIDIMVDPHDPLASIKDTLVDPSGIEPSNQNLYNEGKELKDDNKKAGDYGIGPGTILDLEHKVMTINVETPDGRSHEIQVSPRDTTEQVKQKVEDKTGYAVPKQILKHNGNKLPDGKTLNQSGVKPGDTIKAEIFTVPVIVNLPDGNQVEIMVDPHDPLSSIKNTLENPSGIEPSNQTLYKEGKELADDSKKAGDYGIVPGSVLDLEPKVMNINVETPDGKTHMIQVTPRDTTEQVKQKVEDKTGIAVPKQVLKHNGTELPKCKSLKNSGVKPNDTIKAEIFTVPVIVNLPDGEQVEIMVDPHDPLSSIKDTLQEPSGIEPSNQTLYKEGKELKDDNKKAGDHGIGPGTVLDLEPKVMNINVETPDGKSHTIQVTPRDTTEQVKQKVEAKTGIAAPKQILNHNGNKLPDGKTLKQSGVKPNDTIKAEIFTVPVKVNLPDGRQIDIMVDPHDPLASIKDTLQDPSGIEPSNQTLRKKGKELADDSKKAGDYGIGPGTVLDLEPKTMNINVETPDGKSHTIQVTPRDTTEEVKQRVISKFLAFL